MRPANTMSGSAAWALLDADLTQQSGHKLRLQIPGTAIVSAGVLQAWLHTNSRTGVVQSVPRCQLSVAALLQKLKGKQSPYAAENPDGWVAVAHFSDGLSWLVDAAGLEQLLSKVYVGAVPEEASNYSAAGNAEAEGPALQLLQAYIKPCRDERFVTTFGGNEGSVTSTQVRSYSQRYLGSASAVTAKATALSTVQQAQLSVATAAARRPSRHPASCTGSIASLSAGLAVGEGINAGNSAGVLAEHNDEWCATPQVESRFSSGRGDCGSQALSVEVGGDGHTHLQLQSHGGQSSAYDNACETPTFGLTSAAGDDKQLSAGLFSPVPGPAVMADTAGAAAVDSASDREPGCSTAPPDTWVFEEQRDSASSSGAAECDAAGCSWRPLQVSECAATCGSSRGPSCDGNGAHAAPSRVAKAAAAGVQALISYVDKALGLRVQGLVAEFVQVIAPANEQQPQLVLTGLPHLTMDPQQSRGGTTTFTERWGDFLAGSSPPPAPAPAQHTSYCRTGVQAAMLGSSGQLGTAGSSHAGHGQSGNSEQHCRNSFSPLLQPLLQQQTQGRAGCSASSSGNGSRHLDHAAPGIMGISTADGLQGLSRQVNSQFFPLLLGQHAAVGHRPGSPELLPTGKVPARLLSAPRAPPRASSPPHTRPATASPGRMRNRGPGGSSSSGGGALASRPCTATATRPGAGGNPVLRSSSGDSCRLWLQQPLRPGDSLTAQLAAQVEAAKEQVHQYAEAADAAALTAHCALAQATQQVSTVQQELLQLREDAAAAGHERRQLQQQISTLQRQRSEQESIMQALQHELQELRGQLGQDRATLATMLRQHQECEQQLQEDLAAAQQQNAMLSSNSAHLAARLDEESEVVSALRAQLVDYKLQMGQMQLQAKKGRTLAANNSTNMFRRPGSATPPGQLGLGSISGGLWGVPGAGAMGPESMLIGSSSGRMLTRSGSLTAGSMQGGSNGNGTSDGAPGRAEQQPQRQQQHHRQLSANLSPRAQGAAVGGSSSSNSATCMAGPTAIRAGWPSSALPGNTNSSSRTTADQTGLLAVAGDGPHTCLNSKTGHSPSGHAAAGSTPQHQQHSGQLLGTASQKPEPTTCKQQQPSSTNNETAAPAGCSMNKPASSAQAAANNPPSAAGPAAQSAHATANKHNTTDSSPEAVVAGMVACISSELGASLAAASSVDPPLLIGDLLVGPSGMLEPSAHTQLAVISGLMREIHGDLMEVYGYYAVLGGAQVVADRLTLELPQFGRLAYDLHMPQDNVTLSAVEDVFYMLSDRKAYEVVGTAAGSAHASSSGSASRTHIGRQSPAHARGRASAGIVGGQGQPADDERGADVALPLELLIPEQFPEALVRLACVRYRYGVTSWEYNWDESDSEDETSFNGSFPGEAPLSPRSARLYQHQQQQEQHSRRGPKVLRPEGAALFMPGANIATKSSSGRPRSPSPSRPLSEAYQLPTETDDLATVVRTFLQHEVLKYGRRSKLAGSSLGQRRARDKPPAFQGWQALPPGSHLQ